MSFKRGEWIAIAACGVVLAFLAGVWFGRATVKPVEITVFRK
jgi:hypothetical protein